MIAMIRNLFLNHILKTFFFFLSFSLITVNISAQDISVSGRVIDDSTKAPVNGVTVSVRGKGGKGGVVTNVDGNFNIKAARGATLVFSSVGYNAAEATVDGNAINVSLSPRSSQLADVVVIGYGTRQKKDVTGAISTIGAKDIEKSTSMTPELALQGKAAGVFIESGGGDPLSRPTIRIRGVNTFGFAEPLYVIDGVPVYEGGAGVTSGAVGDIRSPINIFTLVNPNDIESMTVLKDASAAAIYGVRASNGVILITTRRGRTGRPRVEVTSSYGVQNLPKPKKVLNTQQYLALVQEAYLANPNANTTFAQQYGPLYDASSSQYVGNGPTYDWQNELMNKDATIQDYNVKVSGGSDALTYYFSGGYARTESPLKGNNLKRYSIATNLESKISKYVTAGLNVRLISEDALDNTNGTLDDMTSTIPFQPFYDPTDPSGFTPTAKGNVIANPNYDPNLLSPEAPFVFDGAGSEMLWGAQTRYNAFALQALNMRRFNALSALGNAFIQVEPLTGLKIRGTLGGNYYFNFRTEFDDNASWRFKQPAGSPSAPGQNQFAKGTLGKRNTRTLNLNKELTINYNHTFNSDHNVDVVLSASDQFSRWDIFDISGQVDNINPQYWGVSNRPPNTQGFQGILNDDALIGYLARVSYKYKDKYYLDGTLRHDGSSRLAPGHRWDNFPAFAVAWRISSEDFFPKLSFLNDLKIRGGWGKLGNMQSTGGFAYLTTISGTPDYSFGSGNGNGVGTRLPGVSLPGFANTDLTWEKVKTTSVGVDAVLFNNRLSLTAEYYNKLTFDVIQSVALPPNTGIQVPADLNVAQVKNSGIELQLAYNQKFGPVNFNAAANLTTTRNRVIKLNEGTPIGGEGGRIEEGYSMFYLWGYKVGGIFQNQAEIDAWRQKYADINIGHDPSDPTAGYIYKPGDMYFQDVYGDPTDPKQRYSLTPDSLINSNDRTYLGKTIPGYYYGFSVGADFKGFDISAFFQGVGDVQKYNYIRSGLESMGGAANQWATTLDRWTSTNPSKTMPRAVFGDPANATRFSSRFVEDASYLRLKNVQIGYSLPKSLLTKAGFIQNLRLYVSGVNLITITDYTGIDPENEYLPPTKQFLFGVNATF
jgi:TonB-linked SusC/RagA family outer membrane protein